MKKKIDIMIVGAQKAGTSSLKKYLAQYSDFYTHDSLEFTYFVNDEEYKQGYEKSFNKHFPLYKEGNKIIAKSVGIMYIEESLSRLKQHNPDIKIIVVLRHPVDRAYSAYWYARRYGWENIKTFEDSIKADKTRFVDNWIAARFCDYIERSDYYKHIYRIFKIFDRKQVEIIFSDELDKNATEVCSAIMKGYGYTSNVILDMHKKYNSSALPKYGILTQIFTEKNPAKKILKIFIPSSLAKKVKRKVIKMNEKEFSPPPINSNTREQLVEYFRNRNNKLSMLINKDLSFWNK